MQNSFSAKIILSLFLIANLVSSCTVFTGRENAGEYANDTGITTNVKSAIYSEPTLKMFQIRVETFKGVVQLSGFVDSQHQSQRAAEVAQQVVGVKNVKNDLVVRK